MQTTDQRTAIFMCLLLPMYAIYAGFTCIRIIAGHDVRPDLAVWAILGALVLLGATTARNSTLRARASRAREGGGLAASAYARLTDKPRRAGEVPEADWKPQAVAYDANVGYGLAAVATPPIPAIDNALAQAEHDYGADSLYVMRLRGEFVDKILQGDDKASFVTPPGNGDELLVEMVQELDDMLGDLLADPAGISPDSLRTIGRVWRDVCIALGIEQATYMHRDPQHWDAPSAEPECDCGGQDDDLHASHCMTRVAEVIDGKDVQQGSTR